MNLVENGGDYAARSIEVFDGLADLLYEDRVSIAALKRYRREGVGIVNVHLLSLLPSPWSLESCRRI